MFYSYPVALLTNADDRDIRALTSSISLLFGLSAYFILHSPTTPNLRMTLSAVPRSESHIFHITYGYAIVKIVAYNLRTQFLSSPIFLNFLNFSFFQIIRSQGEPRNEFFWAF